MKQKSKKKGQKKSRKKGATGKFFVFLIVIGLGLFLAYHFRQEIQDSLKQFLEERAEKKIVVREKKVVTLYFSEEEGEYLIGEKREISRSNKVAEEAKEAIHELIKGPKGSLIPTLPPGTKLLTIEIDKRGLGKVNFDSTLVGEHPGGSSAEMMTIFSIVNSLTLNFPQIKQVQILIDGKGVDSIAGHISLKQPISSNPKMVKQMGKKSGVR